MFDGWTGRFYNNRYCILWKVAYLQKYWS